MKSVWKFVTRWGMAKLRWWRRRMFGTPSKPRRLIIVKLSPDCPPLLVTTVTSPTAFTGCNTTLPPEETYGYRAKELQRALGR